MPVSRHGRQRAGGDLAAAETGLPWRAMPGPVTRTGRASRRAVRAGGATASAPMKPVSSFSTSRGRPRSARGPPSGRCRRGGSRPPGAACRARRGPAGCAPACDHRVPDRGALGATSSSTPSRVGDRPPGQPGRSAAARSPPARCRRASDRDRHGLPTRGGGGARHRSLEIDVRGKVRTAEVRSKPLYSKAVYCRCFVQFLFVLQYFPILSNRFSFTTTSTLAFLADNYRVIYHPIDYYERVGKSKIRPWHFMDFTVLVLRMAMLFQPMRVFVPAAFLCGFLGLLKVGFDIFAYGLRTGTFGWSLLYQPVLSIFYDIVYCSCGFSVAADRYACGRTPTAY